MGAIFAPRLRSLKYRLRRRLWEWRRGRLPEEITDRIGAVTLCYRVRTDIGRSLYRTGSFEAAEIALIARILRAGPAGAPAILDVGANIGVHSIALCSLFPDARVVAFEPAAGTRRVLERNIRDNGFAERIRVEVPSRTRAERRCCVRAPFRSRRWTTTLATAASPAWTWSRSTSKASRPR
jgi:hypothetical protein